MSVLIVELDQQERARQKQASRDRDLARLAQGEISAQDLQHENSFFGSVDPGSFEIVAIGGRPLVLNR